MNEFPAEGVEMFYESIRRWDEILRRKDSEYWFQLVPGRALSIPPLVVLAEC
jgi:trimethyllysine dioxygenase